MIYSDRPSFGAHFRVAESVRSVREASIACPECQQEAMFFIGPLMVRHPDTGERALIQGVSQQRCGCGTRTVPRTPATASPPRVRRGSSPRIPAVCEGCHREFLTVAKQPARGCSSACRHAIRRRDHGPLRYNGSV